MTTDLIEQIAAMPAADRQQFWNKQQREYARALAVAKEEAQRLLEARTVLADKALRSACGASLASLEYQRDEAVRQLEEQQRVQMEQFRAQWDAHIAVTFGEPRRVHDAEVADAQAEHDATVAQAQAQVTAFEEAFRAGKALAKERARRDRFLSTPAGQREAAEQARARRRDEQELAFAIQTGWPPVHYMGWTLTQHVQMGGAPEQSVYHSVADLREQYLQQYPGQRAMVESPARDLYDAWLAERGGEAERPYPSVDQLA